MNVTRPSERERDFTLAHYGEILARIQQTHQVLSFRDAHRLGRDILGIERFLILRHDVEFSLTSALRLAEEDHAAGVHSTFFLLHTSDYNIFEEEGAAIVRRILELGHDIGLHYDAALFEKMGVDAEAVARQQIALMERFWNTKVYAMSSHMPMRSGKTFSLPGVIDTYDPLYLQEIKYLSDSTQVWREGVVTDLLAHYPHIHLLLHENYWSPEGLGWEALLLLEAKEKFDTHWRRARQNIQRFREGLAMRAHKDREFRKRFGG